MTVQNRYVLLTGATGFLGHYVLRDALRGGLRCVVLLRPPLERSRLRLSRLLRDIGVDIQRAERADRLILVAGHLEGPQPDIGAVSIGTIVHIAAATNFETDAAGDPGRTNVAGTRCVLDWARAWGVRDLHVTSSAYVCGRTRGPVAEAFHPNPPGFHNDYERSKWQAERLCLAWAQSPGHLLTIYRPSIIVGAFGSGRATRFRGFYLSARATELLDRIYRDRSQASRRSIPLRIAGRPDDCQNIVPVDYVSRMIVGVVGHHVGATGPGGSRVDRPARARFYHLVHPDPPTNQLIKEAFERHFGIGGGRFVPPEELPEADLNDYERRFRDVSRPIQHYFVDTPVFERVHAAEAEKALGVACPRYDVDSIGRLVAYGQSVGWGKRGAVSGAVSNAPAPACAEPDDARVITGPSLRGTENAEPAVGMVGCDDSPCARYFELFLPAHIRTSRVARTTAVSANVRFIIEDEPNGDWTCAFDRGKLTGVHRGGGGPREDFGYRTSRAVFRQAISGRIHPDEFFLTGRAEVFGDVERALKMAMILHAFTQECPCVPDQLPAAPAVAT